MSYDTVIPADSEHACMPQRVGNAPLNAPQRVGLPERLEEGRVPARDPVRGHPGPAMAKSPPQPVGADYPGGAPLQAQRDRHGRAVSPGAIGRVNQMVHMLLTQALVLGPVFGAARLPDSDCLRVLILRGLFISYPFRA